MGGGVCVTSGEFRVCSVIVRLSAWVLVFVLCFVVFGGAMAWSAGS